MAKIYIVGVGPGSPDYVTPIARKTVQKADIVVGAERALNLLQDDIKSEKVELKAKKFQETVEYVIKRAKKGLNIVFLSTGDPCFSGLLRPLLKILGGNAELEIVPGISSIQACAARLKICWDEASFISFHEGVDALKKRKLAESARERKTLMILPDPKVFTPSEIAHFLISEGIDEKTPIFICENLTLDDERVFSGSLKDIASLNFSSLCIMVVKPV
jgi:cobalt-precorrin-7 (C5)-methyltransferase